MYSLNERIVQMILSPGKDSLIVEDQDRLVDREIVERVLERGYSVVEFEDSIVFRYIYETGYREQDKKLIVITRETPAEELPFDIYSSFYTVEVSINTLFPKFSRTALEVLDKLELERLYETYSDDLDFLSTRETKEFILKRIYEFDPARRYELSQLIAWLMKLHYNRIQMRDELIDLVMEIAGHKGYDELLDLKKMLLHRESFFEFLQERWPVFLRNYGKFVTNEESKAFFRHKGPASLPFDEPAIKVYVDTMFAEGLLKAVPVDDPVKFGKSWMVIGVDGAGSERIRFGKLAKIATDSLPRTAANFSDWLGFAWRWAELNLVACSISLEESDLSILGSITTLVDSSFENWMREEYGRLLTVSSKFPVTVRDTLSWTSKILHGTGKVALIVIDGMSLLQWSRLSRQLGDLSFVQQTAFAMIPTITSVSRQAIFSGLLPMDLNNLTNNSAEPKLWQRAWIDRGFNERDISYINKADNQLIKAVKNSIEDGQRIIRIVIREVDEKSHAENIGMRSLLAVTDIWLKESCFLDLCDLLLAKGYEVILTSDHGNVEAKGIGNPSEGLIAETRGERVRIYSDSFLRRRIHSQYPDSIEWITAGLPQNYLPLIARGRRAFTTVNSAVVSHGGLTLEEVIVPLIRLRKG